MHASKHEATSSNSELSLIAKPHLLTPTAQFIDSTPKIRTVVTKPEANSIISELKANSGSSSKLNYSHLSKSENITKAVAMSMSNSEAKTKGVKLKRTTKAVAVAEKSEKKLLDPLVFLSKCF